MTKHQKIIQLITEISNSNPIMQDIFLSGSCCNFYFILKSVFPEAKALFNIDHIITKINNKHYDITGCINKNEVIKNKYIPIDEIYFNKYKNDESVKTSEMYDPTNKTKYIKDNSNY